MNTAIRNWLGLVTLVLMVASLFMIFAYVPTEADQESCSGSFIFTFRARGSRSLRSDWSHVAGMLYLWLGVSDLGRPGVRIGGKRDGFLHSDPGDGFAMGAANLGSLVERRFAAHHDLHPVADVRRLPVALARAPMTLRESRALPQ